MEKPILYKHMRCAGISIAIGFIVALSVITIGAVLLLKLGATPTLTDGVAVFAVILGSFIAGFVNARMIRKKGIVVGAVCGVVICLLLLVFKLLLGDATFTGLSVVKLILCMAGAAVGGILGVNQKQRNPYAKV